MNGPERKIIKAALEDGGQEITLQDLDLAKHLAGMEPSAPLSSRTRQQLYAVGKKLGIDGRKEFAEEALERAKTKRQNFQ